MNHTIADIAPETLAAGVDANIGPGAWLTLIGVVTLAGGVLFGTSTPT